MKATGIVRRIDDLGRLVIPKEIRRSLRIRESDPIEIFTERDGEIILRKYARMRELNEYTTTVVQALHGTFGCHALITDTEKVLCAAGSARAQLTGQLLAGSFWDTVRKRQSVIFDDASPRKTELLETPAFPCSSLIALPICAQGDVAGSIAMMTDKANEKLDAAALMTLKAFSLYLGKLLEE